LKAGIDDNEAQPKSKTITTKEIQMRFMMMVKHAENTAVPPQALMDAMDKLIEAEVKEGKMLGTGGLAPTAQSTRVRLSKGKLTITDGPFTEAKEIIGGYAMFDLKSKEEALEKARIFMELHRQHWPEFEGETEIRQIFGPEDFAQHIDTISRKAS
jgi:hypothetical protein